MVKKAGPWVTLPRYSMVIITTLGLFVMRAFLGGLATKGGRIPSETVVGIKRNVRMLKVVEHGIAIASSQAVAHTTRQIGATDGRQKQKGG